MVCEGWEGLTVDGKFPLLEWLGGWGDRCVFLTVGQATHKVNIKLIEASGNDADANVAKWEAAKGFPHPCLLQLMETGRYRIRDTEIAYVVTEKADSFLSGLIPQRTLSAEQMKETLGPVVEALAFLHESGFVHGSVKPSSIVLINTQWKLSPDEMSQAGGPVRLGRELDTYDAPEMGSGAVGGAADMWSLGIILVEACSQRTPVWDRNAAGDLGVPDWLPEPFREIARRCLRWDPAARISAAEAKELLTRMPATAIVEPLLKAKDDEVVEVKEAAVEARPAVSTLAERVAEVRSAGGDELHPRAARGADLRGGEVERRVEPEPDELTPRSRLFSNMAEEEEGPSRAGPVIFGFIAVLVVGVVLGVRYRDKLMPFIQRQNPPAASQTPGHTEVPASQPLTPSPATPAPTQSQSQTVQVPGDTNKTDVANPQTPPAQPSGESSQAAPPQPPATSASESQKSPPAPETKKPEESKPEVVAQTPRVMNAKGAVASRVVPNVAPGARDSMRRPVQVDIRVAVDENGRVTSAQCMTQGSGNYFARISQQAALSWKFKPPISGGEARSSQWMLLFQYSRARTDVIASERH